MVTISGPRELAESWQVAVAAPILPTVVGQQQDWLNTGIYNGPVTAPVIVGDLLVVSDREGRRVVGLDATTGAARWEFVTDARVLTTPTIAQGRVVFGARDGTCMPLMPRPAAWRGALWRHLNNAI